MHRLRIRLLPVVWWKQMSAVWEQNEKVDELKAAATALTGRSTDGNRIDVQLD